jgi:hypothetical protein
MKEILFALICVYARVENEFPLESISSVDRQTPHRLVFRTCPDSISTCELPVECPQVPQAYLSLLLGDLVVELSL